MLDIACPRERTTAAIPTSPIRAPAPPTAAIGPIKDSRPAAAPPTPSKSAAPLVNAVILSGFTSSINEMAWPKANTTMDRPPLDNKLPRPARGCTFATSSLIPRTPIRIAAP